VKTTIGPKSKQAVTPVFLDESFIFGTDLGDKLEKFLPSAHPRSDLYFWGWMAYRDVFSDTKPHITEFCRHLDTVRTAGGELALAFDFGYCDQHNCTDEHCPDYEDIIKLATDLPK